MNENLGQTEIEYRLAQESTGREEKLARRRYQKGSLFIRGKREKVWVGRWLEDEKAGGQRVRRSAILGTLKELPTKKLAQRALDKRLAVVNSSTYRPKRIITFRDLAEKWKATILPTHKPSSQATERAHLRLWSEFLGDLDVKSITGEMVQRYVQTYSQTYKPKTLRNMIGTFRMVWKTAYDWGYTDKDERRILRSVRVSDTEPQEQACFTVDQTRAIIGRAEEPFKTLFWIVAETGIRGGEVCGLEVEDIDLDNQVLSVNRSAWRGRLQTPKTANAVRTFAISDNLAEHIRGYLKNDWTENPDRLMFITRRGRPFNNGDVVRFYLHPVMDELKIPRPSRIGLHALRHANATVLDRLQVPIAVRRGRLGHASFNTTMRYTHMVSADDRKIAGELGAILDPTCPISGEALVESIA